MRIHKLVLFTSLLLSGALLATGRAQTAQTPPNAAQAPAGAPVSTTATLPSTDRKLVIELEVPATVHEVWKAFTTSDGLTSWLAPKATVDLKAGGDWIVSFPGRNSTGGGTIVSFVPEKELVLAALAPDQFPDVRAQRTRAVFTFEAHGDVTVVRLTQTGWKTGTEWDRAYEYLIAGNAQLMSALHRRFAEGPIDWEKIAAADSSKKEQK